MRTKIIFLIAVTSILLNGFLVYKVVRTENSQLRLQQQFPFLSKRIFVENQNDTLINFIPLRQTLREYVGKQSGNVGMYFEYLPTGTSIGVNEKEEVRLASLSKVPIVMSIFKKIERGQLSLDTNLVIATEHLDPHFGTLWEQGAGTIISVEELIRLALTESDNTAYRVLFNQLTIQEINEVYANLDISITQQKGPYETYPLVSPKNYSSIFRSLYLSSFLLKENSNHILHILTQTIFNDKMTADIPDTVKVAHKVGIFERLDTSQDVFVDCGIIYVPNRPYVLCAFVLGTDEQAKKHISYISKMVYDYVVRVNGVE